jgi:hypothetical protein
LFHAQTLSQKAPWSPRWDDSSHRSSWATTSPPTSVRRKSRPCDR